MGYEDSDLRWVLLGGEGEVSPALGPATSGSLAWAGA